MALVCSGGLITGAVISACIFCIDSHENMGKRVGNDRSSYQWISRVVSNYHAIFISVNSIMYLILSSVLNSYEWLDGYWKIILSISSGYMIYDLIVGIFLLDGDVSTICHHVIVAPFLVWLSVNYPKYAALGMLSEVSTPFLNACWFEYHRFKRDGSKLRCFSICLLITYFVFRVLLFPYICAMSIVEKEYYATPLCLLITVMNIVWFYLLIRRFQRI